MNEIQWLLLLQPEICLVLVIALLECPLFMILWEYSIVSRNTQL